MNASKLTDSPPCSHYVLAVSSERKRGFPTRQSTPDDARARTAVLTPDPLEAIASKSIARLFSPREKSQMLGWYGRRLLNAANSVWFTAAFGVSKVLIDPIAKKRSQMRFIQKGEAMSCMTTGMKPGSSWIIR
jgi:hypothetical protein